jgi:hypothetical protein
MKHSPCTYFAARLCDVLRSEGWMVASHNDYPASGEIRTYWSFCRGNQFIDGDGSDDEVALKSCIEKANRLSFQA